MLQDADQRAQATNPAQSYIVQAPAGSGKTELLTQRFLRLLSRVQAPEQIIALTFTRKAANEMRERILLALEKAEQNIPPDNAHQQLTFSYAQAALEQNKRLNWQLLQQPGRLKVMTIDSLCQYLAQSIPLLEQESNFASITENPDEIYRMAARECLQTCLHDHQLQVHIQALLEHLDNRQDKLLDLFSSLLATREQWLGLVYSIREQNKKSFEQALRWIEEHEIKRFQESIPFSLRETLRRLCQHVAAIENDPSSLRYPLKFWDEFGQLNKEISLGLASLLLTKSDKLRSSFDHHVGLRANSCPKSEYQTLKNESRQLLEALEVLADFSSLLVKIKKLPEPVYDKHQWDILQSLLTLLPLLAAHLQIAFARTNKVDFAAVSQQALHALGEPDYPTDLSLYLDHSIHHLLIDEFQDTSIQQYQLLEKLVSGWLPADNKTLFVVGDPMQSIYRFRQAEVGLFLKARQEGIGPVTLQALELCSNFRSTAPVIEWINRQFKTIFPVRDDIESGAISFHPSVNVLKTDSDSHILAKEFSSKAAEAQAVAEIVKTELAQYPDNSVAILVRSRSQLQTIIAILRSQGIAFQGVEIEQLANLPHLQDIWSLTKALLMPADRISWLAFLRSPFIGIPLIDLYHLADADKKAPLLDLMATPSVLQSLSPDSRIRIQFANMQFRQAFKERHQQSLVNWVRSTAQKFHIDSILEPAQEQDIEQFLNLLEKYDENGLLKNLQVFENQLNALYAREASTSRLQIMTIHKSKGLEFDAVILPGLGSKSTQSDKPLFRWLKMPRQADTSLFLMSPVRAAHQQNCQLYDYIGEIHSEKEAYEQQRLLYVATTRAKKRLYLCDHLEKARDGSFRSLLNQEFIAEERGAEEPEQVFPALYRLPVDFFSQGTCFETGIQFSQTTTWPEDDAPRHLGSAIHLLLQWMGEQHPSSLAEIPWHFAANYLKTQGFSLDEQKRAMETIKHYLGLFWSNPVGQWICQQHEEEYSEYSLLVEENNQVATRIIDRMFVENGILWIIDFKTGDESNLSQEEHRLQVDNYARYISQKDHRPVHCGVYYLTTGLWIHWVYKEVTTVVSAS
ncbi:ATP-dependent DNA helicase [Legionella birminghamensis]|uniref:DNA 3'-5' helicase n=1 Tax=Legionella birminghamensis TaxID=28083 RepID=A0A378IFW4_9GAMM|nr:UvrD-helicase domain-containing protein [Legionella birminghamensis]KTC68186.1 ATP-dependent DNA helicase [Legionella birminghamensis]STX31104.1 ATP-dependent DNA helicase (UvrD/Rep helicase) [Legionella birminghamensis]